MAGLLCVAWRTALTWLPVHLQGVRQRITQHVYRLRASSKSIVHNQRLVAIYTWQTQLTLCLKANSLTLYPEAEGHTQEAHFRPRCYTESRVHVVHEFWLAPVNRVRACHCLVFGGDE